MADIPGFCSFEAFVAIIVLHANTHNTGLKDILLLHYNAKPIYPNEGCFLHGSGLMDLLLMPGSPLIEDVGHLLDFSNRTIAEHTKNECPKHSISDWLIDRIVRN